MDIDLELEEKKNKKEYFNKYNKMLKTTKKVLLITFISISIVFLIVALILFLTVKMLELYLPFFIIGSVFLLTSIILYFAIPNKLSEKSYNRIINQNKKYGYMGNISLTVRLELMEQEIKDLKERVNELEKK